MSDVSVTGVAGPQGIDGSTSDPTVSVSIDNTDVNLANNTGTVMFAFSEAPNMNLTRLRCDKEDKKIVPLGELRRPDRRCPRPTDLRIARQPDCDLRANPPENGHLCDTDHPVQPIRDRAHRANTGTEAETDGNQPRIRFRA